MPIIASQITLGTAAPVLAVRSHHMAQDVSIHNQSKSSNQYAYIGGESVSESNSIHIDPGETLQLKIQPGDVLWGISNVADLKVGVIQSLQGG